jgi:tetratricopeptide (TPR) repeat protein
MTEKEITLMSSLALILLECQQPQKAIIFLRALVVLEKTNEKYVYALAWAHLQANQPENALRTLRLLPNIAHLALPHLLSAQALAKLKRFEDAKKELALFIQKKQDTADNAVHDVAVDDN